MKSCIYHADLSQVAARKRFYIEGGPSYWDVFLWKDRSALQKDIECRDGICEGVGNAVLGITCPAPYRDGSIPEFFGELHFARDSWNCEVVAHECMHATFHAMRIFDVEQFPEINVEERICYLHGHLFEDVYKWLWDTEKKV